MSESGHKSKQVAVCENVSIMAIGLREVIVIKGNKTVKIRHA